VKPACLSFLIVNLGMLWTLPIQSVLSRNCPQRVVVFFKGGLPHKNGATSEVVLSLKGYYLSSTSFLTELSDSNLI